MTTFRYLTPARGELRNAAYYYQERSPRVAASFMVEAQKAVNQVLDYPESAPLIRGEVRGKVVSRFPYTLMYRMVDDVAVILAVAHHRQRPEFWIDREP